MRDHPHERAQRRIVRIDQAHAPQIEMHRAWKMSGRKGFCRPPVDDERRPVAGDRRG